MRVVASEADERSQRRTEDLGRVVRVKQADDVQAKVALEPNDVRTGAMKDLEMGVGGTGRVSDQRAPSLRTARQYAP